MTCFKLHVGAIFSTLVDASIMSCAVALTLEQRGLHSSLRRLRFRAGMMISCACVSKIVHELSFHLNLFRTHVMQIVSLLVRSFV